MVTIGQIYSRIIGDIVHREIYMDIGTQVEINRVFVNIFIYFFFLVARFEPLVVQAPPWSQGFISSTPPRALIIYRPLR